MKLKSFCTTKELVSNLKRLPTEWKKIFASYTSDKGLITRTHKELKKLKSPKINEPIKSGQLNKQNIFNGRSPNGQKHRKKYSPLMGIKEMQIKTHYNSTSLLLE
jgi:hypothetical protein